MAVVLRPTWGRDPSGRLPWGVTRGLTARWPLDSASCAFNTAGNQVVPLDIVGNNYGSDAKSKGAAGGPPTDVGNIYYNYDGTTNTYLVVNSDFLQGTTGSSINATFAVWVYLNSYAASGGTVRFFQAAADLTITMEDGGQGSGTNTGGIIVENEGVSFSRSQAKTTSPVMPLNTWAHLAVTFASGLPTGIYINGTAIGIDANLFNLGFSGSAVYGIGCRDNANRIMNGKLADARVYNGTVLTADEINQLYLSAFIQDPGYGYSLPDEGEMPVLFVAAAPVVTQNQGWTLGLMGVG